MLMCGRLLTDLCEHRATESHQSISNGFPHYVYVNIVVYYVYMFYRVESSKLGNSMEIKYLKHGKDEHSPT